MTAVKLCDCGCSVATITRGLKVSIVYFWSQQEEEHFFFFLAVMFEVFSHLKATVLSLLSRDLSISVKCSASKTGR